MKIVAEKLEVPFHYVGIGSKFTVGDDTHFIKLSNKFGSFILNAEHHIAEGDVRKCNFKAGEIVLVEVG